MSETVPTRWPRGVKPLLGISVVVIAAAFGQTTVLGKQIFDMTRSELHLGYLGLTQFAPAMVLAPISGSVADRFDRRFVLGAALAGQSLCAFAQYLYIGTDPTAVGPIYAIAFVFGICEAFAAVSIRALPIDVVPPSFVPRVVALDSVAFQSGIILGPVAAGFLFVAAPELPYIVIAGALACGVVLLFFVPHITRDTMTTDLGARAMVRDAFDGLRTVRRTPILFGAISLDLFAVLFGGAIALLPAIADKRLGVGAVGLGWLNASMGIGAGAMALLLAVRPLQRRVGPALFTVVATFGVATVVLGLTRSYAVAFVALLVAAMADQLSVFIRRSLVPLATPPALRGRVLAVENVFIGASNELGGFESGVAAALIGLSGAVVFGGVATVGVVVIWAALFPALRRVDRFEEAAFDPEEVQGNPLGGFP